MNVNDLLRSIQSRGGGEISADYAPFGRDLRAILKLRPDQVSDVDLFETALAHAFSYFYWKWDPAALELLPGLGALIEAWSRSPRASLNVLCTLADFHYFVTWCFTSSSAEQCRWAVPVMRHLGNRFAEQRRSPCPPPLSGREPRVVWLAMYADSDGPMSIVLRHSAPALRAGGCELIVYAWRFHDEPFLRRLQEQGATCRVFDAAKPQLLIEAIERELDADRPDVVIADMNNAVPTALFARRAAPAQIFLQMGMPAWAGPGLDAVINGFGFDAELAGWGSAMQLPLDPPWDLVELAGAASEEEIAAERGRFPPELRLVGSYGRLVKVTIEYLQAAEAILERCPDAALILGGTGDASHIRNFIAASPVGDRIFLDKRFVPKHVWGQLLTLFLDSWPVTGGESAREMLAKGKPVVTLRSLEMPAIHLQRDPALIAADWTEYENLAVDLLEAPGAYAGASARASALALKKSDPEPFTAQLNGDIRRVLALTG